jgi:hypothetical protein
VIQLLSLAFIQVSVSSQPHVPLTKWPFNKHVKLPLKLVIKPQAYPLLYQKAVSSSLLTFPSLRPTLYQNAVSSSFLTFSSFRPTTNFLSIEYPSRAHLQQPVQRHRPWRNTDVCSSLPRVSAKNVLLCNADTNLEYTQHSKKESGATAAFDPAKPHMCRDYSKVFAFAEK